MSKTKHYIWISLFSVVSFVGYFVAVLASEHTKQITQLAEIEARYLNQKRASEDARYQYYQDVAKRKAEFQASMAEAKAQYEQLLKDQPAIVKEHQTQKTVTTQEPYTVKVTPTPSPKPTRSTKTS